MTSWRNVLLQPRCVARECRHFAGVVYKRPEDPSSAVRRAVPRPAGRRLAGSATGSRPSSRRGRSRSACVVNGRLRQEGRGRLPASAAVPARETTHGTARACCACCCNYPPATGSTGPRGTAGHPAAGPDLLCRDIRRLIHGCLPRRPQKTNPAPPPRTRPLRKRSRARPSTGKAGPSRSALPEQ